MKDNHQFFRCTLEDCEDGFAQYNIIYFEVMASIRTIENELVRQLGFPQNLSNQTSWPV